MESSIDIKDQTEHYFVKELARRTDEGQIKNIARSEIQSLIEKINKENLYYDLHQKL